MSRSGRTMRKAEIAEDRGLNSAAAEQPPERLLSIQTVAELMDVSASSVRRLIADGALEVVYVGALVRVPERSFRAFVNAGMRRRKSPSKR